ncbi:hypothetical protein ACTNDG_04310 [Clostridium sp. HCP1S3_B4]|uniref:hypothetical protein n=1 Tax=unclassified Clostridium TaxID=2614128 RepID=UPI00169480FF|nr:hypothetical protein [Clostridiales bacterium]MDY2729604.1 hypothetical protein [Clostridium sp.]NLK24397.1 hypothetical protein [Clostridiales bacterium]
MESSNNKNKKVYLPKERTCYTPDNNIKNSGAPNPAQDPIVCNNIAWQEGNYIENDYTDKDL